MRASQQSGDFGRRAGRAIIGLDAMTTSLGHEVLAEQRTGRRVEQPHMPLIPLYAHHAADPARRWCIVRGSDLYEAVEVDDAVTEGVAAKWLDGERAEMRSLVGKHRGDLALGRAVDPRVGHRSSQ